MKKISLIALLVATGFIMGCTGKTKEEVDGISLMQDKKYEEAITYYKKNVEEGKNIGESYRMIGTAYFELEKYPEAVEALENASKNGVQKSAIFYSLMADSYMKVGEYERALAYYSKAARREDIAEQTKQENALNEIAIYQELGEWDFVKEKAEAYKKAYPDDTRIDKTLEFLETR